MGVRTYVIIMYGSGCKYICGRPAATPHAPAPGNGDGVNLIGGAKQSLGRNPTITAVLALLAGVWGGF